MRLLTIIFTIISFGLFAQTGSINFSVGRSKVTDTASVTIPSGYGGIRFKNQASQTKWQFTNDGTNWFRMIGGNIGNNYVPKFNSTTGMLTNSQIFDNGTNVGINNSSPGRELTLHASTNPDFQITNSDTGTGSGDGFVINQSQLNTVFNNMESGYMAFSTSNTERMRLLSGGNMGIGLVAPSKELTLFADANPDFQIVNTATGTTATDGFLINQSTVNSLLINHEVGPMAFYTSGIERFQINSSGALGFAGTNFGTSGQVPVSGGSSTTPSWNWAVPNADRGDITTLSNGDTYTIDNDVVTYAKLQNVSAASRLLGRGSSGGSGDTEEISLGAGLTMSGTTLRANIDGSGSTNKMAYWGSSTNLTFDTDFSYDGTDLSFFKADEAINGGNYLVMANGYQLFSGFPASSYTGSIPDNGMLHQMVGGGSSWYMYDSDENVGFNANRHQTNAELDGSDHFYFEDTRSGNKQGIEYKDSGYVTQLHSLTDKEYVDAQVSGNSYSGTYTPTGTNVSNAASITTNSTMYFVVDGIVHVFGEVTIDPTLAAITTFRLELPLASELSNTYDLAGTGMGFNTLAEPVKISAQTTNNEALFAVIMSDTDATTFSFQFSYKYVAL